MAEAKMKTIYDAYLAFRERQEAETPLIVPIQGRGDELRRFLRRMTHIMSALS